MLEVTVQNLREHNRTDELGGGIFYISLQRKMTVNMLAKYHRWIFEKGKSELVESMYEWAMQESEFRTVAAETVQVITTRHQDQETRLDMELAIWCKMKRMLSR